MTLIGLLVFGCTIEDGKDLNGPETVSISEGVSRPELPQVVAGILADMRDRLNTQDRCYFGSWTGLLETSEF